jgi:hypothetical protein
MITIAVPSHAALLLATGTPAGLSAGLLSLVAIKFIINKNKRRWVALVDPLNVESFQLDLSYDPNRMQYLGVQYVEPYVNSGPFGPDLSVPGLVQDIIGQVSIPIPPPGEVDIFGVEFDDLEPTSDLPSYFTIFASSNDYIRALDTNTGNYVIADWTTIFPTTASTVPEPDGLSLMLAGLAFPVTSRLIRNFKTRTEGQPA